MNNFLILKISLSGCLQKHPKNEKAHTGCKHSRIGALSGHNCMSRYLRFQDVPSVFHFYDSRSFMLFCPHGSHIF